MYKENFLKIFWSPFILMFPSSVYYNTNRCVSVDNTQYVVVVFLTYLVDLYSNN